MSLDGENPERSSPRDNGDTVRAKVYPLSSKRLTQSHLKALGTALGVPTTATAEDIRLMIGRALSDMGKEQQNVEVVHHKQSSGSRSIGLRDENGIFLEVNCEPVVTASPTASSDDEEEDDGERSGSSETANLTSWEETAETEQERTNKQELLECRVELAETRNALDAEVQKTQALESELTSKLEEVSELKARYECEREKSRRTWIVMPFVMIAISLIVTIIFISLCVTMCITRHINRSRISPETNNFHTVALL